MLAVGCGRRSKDSQAPDGPATEQQREWATAFTEEHGFGLELVDWALAREDLRTHAGRLWRIVVEGAAKPVVASVVSAVVRGIVDR